jgi:[acyl-carrier-protein] S-malonyltransferase
MMLPMSIPSHCRLMTSAAEKMRRQLASTTLQTPDIPVLHNVDVKTHRDVDAIRDILAQQLYSPVRWVDTIRRLAADSVTHVVECGPGNILTGLDKRIDRDLQHLSLSKSEAVRETISILC